MQAAEGVTEPISVQLKGALDWVEESIMLFYLSVQDK